MYRLPNRNQLSIDEFMMPFGGKLSAENRWVKKAKLIPWDLVEDLYAETFKAENPDGRPPIPARIAFGAIYVKEEENLTDERTVEYISENPYMQYFLGLKEFRQERLFDPSIMVSFRKRFNTEAIQKINDELYKRTHKEHGEPPEDGMGNGGMDDAATSNNSGTLILDATCAPSDIRYPTDLSLLNECRENTEKMIEKLWQYTNRQGHKTGYNRKTARAKYLKLQKQRRPRKKAMRQAIGEQLEYVGKNIQTLAGLIGQAGQERLSDQEMARLEVIRQVHEQQLEMHKARTHSCNQRIVSLRQPHVRPIVRGKAGCVAEFGQKIALGVVDGFSFIEEQKWENFSEGNTLQDSAETYRRRFGFYPKAILADMAYRNEGNRKFCKEHGIRFSGPRRGRPKPSEYESDKKQAYQDSCERNMVESRNGISKRRYGLDLIMAYLKNTAETEAALQIFAMNVAHVIRALLQLISRRRYLQGAVCFLLVFK